MLNNAGREIINATSNWRIPLANSRTLSNLAILKIRITLRRLGLTTVSFELISSRTTPVKIIGLGSQTSYNSLKYLKGASFIFSWKK